jgi:hypothetical protein
MIMARKKAPLFVDNTVLTTALQELFDYDLKGFEAADLLVEDDKKDESRAWVTFTITRPSKKDYDAAEAYRVEIEKLMREAFAEEGLQVAEGSDPSAP